MTRRLYRSAREKMLGGVAGGLAEYFDIDVALVRLLWLVTVIFWGLGLPAYFIAWALIPLDPGYRGIYRDSPEQETGEKPFDAAVDEEERAARRQRNKKFVGYVLIGLGAIFLLNQIMPWFQLHRLWPLVLIIVGVLVLYKGTEGDK